MSTATLARAPLVPDRRQRLLILGICSMSLLIVGLDATIVNIALPSIRSSLDTSSAGLQWIVDAYTLVLASLLMLAGSTADRYGRRRIFLAGLVVFTLASLLCAIAPSLELLIAARMLQAVGGAMLNPVALSIIRTAFEDPRERVWAIGIWGAVGGISMALGPVLGGLLVSGSWRAIFLVNLPVGLAVIALTLRNIPESRAPRPRRIDPIGQLLVIAGLATLTYGVIEGGHAGFDDVWVATLLIVAVACFVALVLYELRRREPLLEMRFFNSLPFAGAIGAAVFLFAAVGGFLFLNTLYLQEVRGLSPLMAGVYTLPAAAMMIAFAPLSGRVTGRYGPRWPMVGGGLAVFVAGLMLLSLAPDTSLLQLFGAYVLIGIGMAVVNPPITNAAMVGMPPAQAGVASAVATTGRQIGLTLGVAVLGAVAGGGLGASIATEFAAATEAAWWIVAMLGLAIAVLGYVTTTAWAIATARRTAERLERGETLEAGDLELRDRPVGEPSGAMGAP